MTTYELICSDNKSYGVRITKVMIINNISDNYEAVKNLTDTCNRCEVDMEHFPDVLENFLTDYNF